MSFADPNYQLWSTGPKGKSMMEATVERSSVESWPFEYQQLSLTRKIVKRVFGCWHLKLSLPFTRGDETYRTCISCGARRRFDLDQWKMVGGYYYPKK